MLKILMFLEHLLVNLDRCLPDKKIMNLLEFSVFLVLDLVVTGESIYDWLFIGC
ncbi:hypothetical protein HanXRQr2_Chr12g0525981 [Helianthus annuus]|uniref:Uncharacterized protein n=1 Tax=Helianthus annuus TaxID=4232 RepID=A0A9K3EML3_HELAN|nr:hypothetical protein HanXRQr2_Chr12g0525981 [Helianthus annuus]